MKMALHTMAMAKIPVEDAISAAAQMGFDGIEIIVRDDGVFRADATDGQIESIVAAAKENGVEISSLTPYYNEYHHTDSAIRKTHLGGLMRTVELAGRMGVKNVRAFGGVEHKELDQKRLWGNAIAGLKEVGAMAARSGISINVENHHVTLTPTGEKTIELLNAVGLENVRALYDPCNVLFFDIEGWKDTLGVQLGRIGYVHVKDYYIQGKERRACPVGDGMVPWAQIIPLLKKSGYDGFLSFEYEKLWFPSELPDPEIGLASSLRHIKEIVGAM
jgi:sugar phosphate isomerase/epimerase